MIFRKYSGIPVDCCPGPGASEALIILSFHERAKTVRLISPPS
jgi:hypothetical protein